MIISHSTRIAAALLLASCAATAQSRTYAIFHGDTRFGYEKTGSRIAGAQRITTTETVQQLAILGAPTDVRTTAETAAPASGGAPVRYATTTTRGALTVSTVCTFERGALRTETTAAGRATTRALPWSDDCVLLAGDITEMAERLNAALGTRPSRSMRLFVPDLGTFLSGKVARARPVDRLLGKREMCDVLLVDAPGVTMQILVSQADHVAVEYRLIDQTVSVRIADDAATTGLQRYEVLASAFSPTNVHFVDGQEVDTMKARVRARTTLATVTPASLQTPWQTFRGTVTKGRIDGVFEVRRQRYAGRRAPRLTGRAPSASALAPFLRPEPNVESDAPEIAAQARQLVAGSATQWDAARRIARWVFGSIRYSITGAGALQCLTSRTGDCGPKAFLAIALCRAAGIPARLAGGAVYGPAYGGSFGQHYWVRVWMGPDGWVPVDPTTGEIGSMSAARLTLYGLGGVPELDLRVLHFTPLLASRAYRDRNLQRTPLVFRKGDRERYVFRMGGKVIGEQTAECVAVRGAGARAVGDWKLAMHLDFVQNGVNYLRVLQGMLTMDRGARPRALWTTMDIGSGAQKVTYTFQQDRVVATTNLWGNDQQQAARVEGTEFLILNNAPSILSFTTRTLRIAAGRKISAGVFSAESLAAFNMRLFARPRTEAIQVGGRSVECVVIDTTFAGAVIYVDRRTGELMRYRQDNQALVIDRE